MRSSAQDRKTVSNKSNISARIKVTFSLKNQILDNLEVSNERKEDDNLTQSYNLNENMEMESNENLQTSQKIEVVEKQISLNQPTIEEKSEPIDDKESEGQRETEEEAKNESEDDVESLEEIANIDSMEPKIDFDEENEEFKNFEKERVETELDNIYENLEKKDEVKGNNNPKISQKRMMTVQTTAKRRKLRAM